MIAIAPMTAKETNCSMFALRHHTRQRLMFSSSRGNVYRFPDGAASSSPVIGETIRGT
jgi:hypothetical protein